MFQKGFDAHMMAIDGTWRRTCILKDVSEAGARLIMQASIEGLPLKEFFLLLSSTGLAYRRCELAWINGEQIGANFIKKPVKKSNRPLRWAEPESENV